MNRKIMKMKINKMRKQLILFLLLVTAAGSAFAQTSTMTDDQVNDIKSGKEKLMASAQQLFSKVYESAQAQQGAANAGDAQQSGPAADDGVVDGDFKEV